VVLKDKRIALGVSGSIAAYKAVEIARLLVKNEARVTAILSREACRFVTPLTFETITGSPAITDLFGGGDWTGTGRSAAATMAHIDLSRDVDAFLVAPATANVIGKAAHGIADDALTTALITCPAPLVIAPAMNFRMWENSQVRRNVAQLRGAGVVFVGPESGPLAEGEVGLGRLSDPEFIVDELRRVLTPASALSGRRVVVTSGRTEEALDPVRFMTNRSSGKMGFALALAARHAGALVTLVTGKSSVAPPRGVEVVKVRSTDEMADAVEREVADADVLIMAAAVSDYRPLQERLHKIESGSERLVMEFMPTQDILRKIKGNKGRRVFVGFALETKNEVENGRRKLVDKGLDLICVNNPLKPGSEFGSDTNIVTLVSRTGRVEVLPRLPKYEVACEILKRVSEFLAPAGAASRAVEPEARAAEEDAGDAASDEAAADAAEARPAPPAPGQRRAPGGIRRGRRGGRRHHVGRPPGRGGDRGNGGARD
jgi:phosphopantothenoylcysteine decarboxylase/phosphopantothenate--cysteine ligase